MSEYTPITGELRDWFEHAYNYGTGDDMFKKGPAPWFGWKSMIEQMLDAIDAVHAQLERENVALKAELDRVLGEQENRDGWVELPKDADGVPIRFKDKVTVPWSDKVYEVSGFSYQENVHTGTMTIWINTHIDGKYRALCATDSCHHHEPDTWERIIADAVGCMDYEVEGDDDLMALVARCKALCERTKGGDAK